MIQLHRAHHLGSEWWEENKFSLERTVKKKRKGLTRKQKHTKTSLGNPSQPQTSKASGRPGRSGYPKNSGRVFRISGFENSNTIYSKNKQNPTFRVLDNFGFEFGLICTTRYRLWPAQASTPPTTAEPQSRPPPLAALDTDGAGSAGCRPSDCRAREDEGRLAHCWVLAYSRGPRGRRG
jgi:hypothetical protein